MTTRIKIETVITIIKNIKHNQVFEITIHATAK